MSPATASVRVHVTRGRVCGAAAALGYLFTCIVVLAAPAKLPEPDDWSYRAQLEALRMGHVTLDATQFSAVELAMRRQGGAANQWVRLPGGRYLSEKNPGYCFLAAPFFLLGLIRLAPLAFLALGCAALWLAGRRLSNELGACAAVLLFLASPAVLVMAARPYMPTAAELSLVAAGLGFYAYCALAKEEPMRRRAWLGALAFALAGTAVPVRFTSALGLVLLAAHACLFMRANAVPARVLLLWACAAALPLALLAVYNVVVFGAPLAHAYAYSHRMIAFTIAALADNLKLGPAREWWAMPALPLAVIATGAYGWLRPAGTRFALLFAAVLASYWVAWAMYGWTSMAYRAHVMVTIRPLLPAVGAVALLGGPLLSRRWPLAALALVAVCAFSFHEYRKTVPLGAHFAPGVQSPVRGGACPPGLECPSGFPVSGRRIGE